MCSSLGGGGEGEGGGGEGEGGGVGGGNGGEGGGGNSGEGGGGGGGGGGESSDSTDCSEAITRLERQSTTTKRILRDKLEDSHYLCAPPRRDSARFTVRWVRLGSIV